MFKKIKRNLVFVIVTALILQLTPFTAASVFARTNTDITFEISQLGGAYLTADTTGIEINFCRPATGLTINDITILEVNGRVTRGALRGGGTRFILDINEVAAHGEISISIRNFGAFNVVTGSLSVFVYKDTTIPLTFSASINPTSKTFDTAEVGYDNATMAQVFTITNTGTGQITGLTASLGGANFWTPGLSDTTIEPGGSVTIGVRPRNNLLPNTAPYTDTLTVTGSNGINFSVPLSFTVVEAPVYEISITPDGPIRLTAQEGYDNTAKVQVFTIKNTGTAQITNLSASLATYLIGEPVFEISAGLSATSINPGQSATVSVRPLSGILDGTYKDLLMILGNNDIGEVVELHFTVNREIVYSATLDPSYKEFAPAEEGYDNEAMAHIFTVTNTGTETITDLEAALGSTNYFWAAPLSANSIHPGETATIGIRPRNNLAPRDEPYTDTLTITGSSDISLTAQLSFTVTEIVIDHGVVVDPLNIELKVRVPYTNDELSQVITISNTGTEVITDLSAVLGKGSASDFGLDQRFRLDGKTVTSIQPGETVRISLWPRNNRVPGTDPYEDTLTIRGTFDNHVIDLAVVNLSFLVMDEEDDNSGGDNGTGDNGDNGGDNGSGDNGDNGGDNGSGDNVKLGDLNGDGVIDSADLILMLRFFTQPDTDIILAAADVNGDGEVDMADLILFLRFFVQPGIVLGPQ